MFLRSSVLRCEVSMSIPKDRAVSAQPNASSRMSTLREMGVPLLRARTARSTQAVAAIAALNFLFSSGVRRLSLPILSDAIWYLPFDTKSSASLG